MRACFQKSTGKLLEYQSNPSEGTLILNAIGQGYLESDLVEKDLTPMELGALDANIMLENKTSQLNALKILDNIPKEIQAIAILMMKQLNVLRQKAGLPALTINDVKTAYTTERAALG